MSLLLGIDLGTSYFKIGLFSRTGALQGLARLKVETVSSAPDRVELPVGRFWELLRRGLQQALQAAHADPADIAGVSYSSQANTFLLLDETDAPITPLIFWTDRRAPRSPLLETFSSTSRFAGTAGFFKIGEEWAASKLHWFKHHEPETWKRVRHVKTISDYLTFALTGRHVGDAGTAAFLGLYDLQRGTWWPEALDVVGLAPACLGRPLLPGSAVGPTTSAAYRLMGLPSGIPFCVGGLDHQVAALGSGLGAGADASISTGTVLAAMRLTPAPTAEPNCYHGPSFRGGEYYRLAFHSDGAARLERLQRELCPRIPIGDMIAAAIPEYAGQSPHLLSSGALGRIRAVLGDIAQAHLQLLRQIAPSLDIKTLVATGGGSRSIPWLRLKADLFRIPIITPLCPERACLGAAMLAAHAAGLYATLDDSIGGMAGWSAPILPRA